MPEFIPRPNPQLIGEIINAYKANQAYKERRIKEKEEAVQKVFSTVNEFYKDKEAKAKEKMMMVEAMKDLDIKRGMEAAENERKQRETEAGIMEKFQFTQARAPSQQDIMAATGRLGGDIPSSEQVRAMLQPKAPEGFEQSPEGMAKYGRYYKPRPKEPVTAKKVIEQSDLPVVYDLMKTFGVEEKEIIDKAQKYIGHEWGILTKALGAVQKKEITGANIGEQQAKGMSTAFNVPLTSNELKSFSELSQPVATAAFKARRAAFDQQDYVNEYGIKFPKNIEGKVNPFIEKASNEAIDILAPAKKAASVISEVYGNFLNGVATDDVVLANIKKFTDPVVAKIKKDPQYATADDLRMGMAALVARGIAGEKGTLAEGDVKRAYSLMPGFGDTTAQIKAKLVSLTKMMEAGVDAAYGRVPSQFLTPKQDRYDYVMGEIYKLLPTKKESHVKPQPKGEAKPSNEISAW